MRAPPPLRSSRRTLSAVSALPLVWLAACANGDTEGGGDEQVCDPRTGVCTSGGGNDAGRGRDGGRSDGGDDAGGGGRDTGGGSSPCDPRTCEDFGAASPTDSDEDGIPDCVEGGGDPDADGLASCVDDDADGDGVSDSQEGVGDPDGDEIPNFQDLDADGDNIPDDVDGAEDPDEDGIRSFLDTDSDGDGWPDAAEYGREPTSGMRPVDTDGDGAQDYQDLDADGDGLPDSSEFGCPTSTDRLLVDTDGDGYNDLVEVAFGGVVMACDVAANISSVVDFYFELPYLGPPDSDLLEFSTNVKDGDVVFNMDTTGSMSGAISQLTSSLESTIVPALLRQLPSPAYAVSRFNDFPCGGHGDRGDVPFEMLQRVTRSAGDARNAVTRLRASGGADINESGFESLFQIASGAGRVSGTQSCTNVPPFNSAAGTVVDVADGTIGGVGFREGALPIIVHITDAPSHARADDGYAYGATREEAYSALGAIGARVVGVVAGGSPGARTDTLEMVNRTGAVVPACAWDASRPSNCSGGQCCTGQGGRGTPPAGDQCPLLFDVGGDGTGLDTSIVSGIESLLRFVAVDVSTRVRPDPAQLAVGIDTSCFISGVVPESFTLPSDRTCVTTPEAADLDGDGALDGFRNVTPGTVLQFRVNAENPCVPPTREPQVFIAFIDVVGDGTTVLDTQTVSVLVPPALKL